MADEKKVPDSKTPMPSEKPASVAEPKNPKADIEPRKTDYQRPGKPDRGIGKEG